MTIKGTSQPKYSFKSGINPCPKNNTHQTRFRYHCAGVGRWRLQFKSVTATRGATHNQTHQKFQVTMQNCTSAGMARFVWFPLAIMSSVLGAIMSRLKCNMIYCGISVNVNVCVCWSELDKTSYSLCKFVAGGFAG